MNYPKPSQRYALAAIVVLVFITLGLSIPIFVSGRPQSIVLQNAAVHAATSDTYTVTTPIQLSTTPALFLQSGTLSIAPERGRAPVSGEAAAKLLASGSARLLLEDATIVLDTESAGAAVPGVSAEALAAPLLAAVSKLGFSALTIHRGVIAVKRGSSGAEVMSDVRVHVTAKRGVSLTAAGSFELQGRQMTLDATLGLVSDRKDITRLPLKATLKGALMDATIADGHLVVSDKLHLTAGQAEVKVAGLRPTAGWLGAPWPGERGLNAFQAKGKLDWQDRTISFSNAAFQMDGNEATGTLAFGWGKARPVVEGTLALKKCDLTKYIAAEKPGSFMERSVLGWLSAASEPGSLALPLIRHLDADLRISADQVKAGALTLGRSAASISVRDTKLLADLAEVEIESDGSMRGQITVDMGGLVPRYIVRGKLESVDAAKATGLVFGHPAMAGRANIMFDLAGFGETIEQIASTLHGKTGIELPDGGSLGLDIAQLASTASRSAEIKGWGPAGRGQTKVTALSSKFGMQSGMLYAEAFKAKSGDRLLTLSGGIDLKRQLLDSQLSIIKLVAADSGNDTTASEPAEIINLRGPWQEPDIRFTTRPGKAAYPNVPTAPNVQPGPAQVVRQPG